MDWICVKVDNQQKSSERKMLVKNIVHKYWSYLWTFILPNILHSLCKRTTLASHQTSSNVESLIQLSTSFKFKDNVNKFIFWDTRWVKCCMYFVGYLVWYFFFNLHYSVIWWHHIVTSMKQELWWVHQAGPTSWSRKFNVKKRLHNLCTWYSMGKMFEMNAFKEINVFYIFIKFIT